MSRIERIAQIIKKEVSSIVSSKLADPRIGFSSITEVKLTPDLKIAKIFMSIYGDEKAKSAAMKGLKCATKFIKGELGKRLELRFMPDISFIRDDSIERGSKIITMINELTTGNKNVKKINRKNKRRS